MLAHEWRELEVLCERIGDLRYRFAHAQRTKNAGLLGGLKNDIVTANRQRELLVRHISARLGSVAAARSHGVRSPPAPEASLAEAKAADDAEADLESAALYGFPDD